MRRFVEFNPLEPRPTKPVQAGPGTLAALFDIEAVRLSPWVPMSGAREVSWTVPDGVDMWSPEFAVLWDGGDRWGTVPFDRQYRVHGSGSLFTLVMPRAMLV